MCVWDSRTGVCVEQSKLACSLVSLPSRAHELVEKLDPYADITQSIKTFRGKIFILVCAIICYSSYL